MTHQSSEAVLAHFPTRIRDPRTGPVLVRDTPARAANDRLDDEDDDHGFLAEMFEQTPTEFFINFVLFPLAGAAVAAVLLFITCASLWASMKLLMAMHAAL